MAYIKAGKLNKKNRPVVFYISQKIGEFNTKTSLPGWISFNAVTILLQDHNYYYNDGNCI